MESGCRRFGIFLRGLRSARRLTLEDVERRTRGEPEPVTRSLLSRLENGKARVSTLKLMALARVYGVRLALLAERLELEHRLSIGSTRAPRPFDPPRADEPQAARERLALAARLVREGSSLSARHLIEEIGFAPLARSERARALCVYARAALDSGQELLARGAIGALRDLDDACDDATAAAARAVEATLIEADGAHDEALEAWLGALDAARLCGDRELEARCLVRLAGAERRRGRFARALAWCARAGGLARRNDDERARIAALVESGRIHRARGRPARARRAWRTARDAARAAPHHAELFTIHLELWRLGRAEGDAATARAALRALRHLGRLIDTWPRGCDDLREALDGRSATAPPTADVTPPPPPRSRADARA